MFFKLQYVKCLQAMSVVCGFSQKDFMVVLIGKMVIIVVIIVIFQEKQLLTLSHI